MKKLLSVLYLSIFVLSGCSGSKDVITVSGSTSVESFFVENLAPEIENDLGYTIEYQATGSSAGIEAAQNSTAMFGTSSRKLTDEESASGIVQQVIAYDGIAVIVNPNNLITDLTTEQIIKIYTGEITNWSEVGGTDSDISVVSREDGSGTRNAFEEILGIENKLTADATIADGNGNVASTVAANDNTIGYVSFSTLSDNSDTISAVNINGITPEAASVISDEYILSRPFLLLHNSENITEEQQDIINWMNENAQELAPESGLIAA